jgi:uncharacterized glyoxalase superfamily protein PhnB
VDNPTFVPALSYRDPKAALAWLEHAFGFETTMAIEGADGDVTTSHYEMALAGQGRIMVGAEWAEWTKSPLSAGGVNTQSLHVEVPGDLDEHCERARAAGAVIVREPEDQFYGDRVYQALDLEQHNWSFSVHVRDVARADAEEAIGAKIEAKNWA